MNTKVGIRIILYIPLVVVVILFINLAVNFFVSLQTPSRFNVSGDIDSWIQFNGNLAGSIIGGIIAGYIAISIARLQIEKEGENNRKMRQLQLKQDISMETNGKLIAITVNLLETLCYKQVLISKFQKLLFEYVQSYEKSEDSTYKKMREHFDKAYEYLDKKGRESHDYRAELARIYWAFTIVLSVYKKQIEEITDSLVNDDYIFLSLMNIAETFKNEVAQRRKITSTMVEKFTKLYKDFKREGNILNYKIECLKVDLQNALHPLFDEKLDRPEFEEIFQ